MKHTVFMKGNRYRIHILKLTYPIYLFLDVTEHPNDDNENNDPSWTPTCSEDKFLCPGSSDCIWEAWLCDHEDDCPGGEDESKEVCADRPICDKNMFR